MKLKPSQENVAELRGQSGFTLVEVLISLFIFSILSASTLSSVRAAIFAKEKLSDKTQELTELQIMNALIRSDLAAAVLSPVRERSTGFNPHLFVGGKIGAHDQKGRTPLLSLSRAGIINPEGLQKRGNLTRVHYVLDRDQLIRVSSSRLNGLETTPPRERVIMSKIQTLSLGFYGRAAPKIKSSIWQVKLHPEFDDDITQLPDLMEMKLEFDNGKTLKYLWEVGT